MGIYYKDHPMSSLKVNGDTITDITLIANTIAKAFANVSSSDSFPRDFLRYKRKAEACKINFSTQCDISYNNPFTGKELYRCLQHSQLSSPGPDKITYKLLQNLSKKSLSNILYLFNRIWQEHTFPSQWQKAILLPIAKPGKDASDPKNYRPIALTSCLSKLLEKMVNNRLMYFLETNNHLSPYQSGFRKGRSTLDNIVNLESRIRNAFVKRNHLISVFFDIEKAYDRTWRYGILRDIYNIGLRGNLPIFISNFLSLRNFNVRIGHVLSDNFIQEEGVPQGSVLSVTLFIIKINSVLHQLPPSVHGTLYVDDLQISCEGKEVRYAERQLQTAIHRISKWCSENGFNISSEKTVCVHFCRLRKLHNDPELYFRQSPITVTDTVRFLGVTFDKKLTFVPHIKNLRLKCEKTLNLLKVLSNTSWGADRTSMMRIYRSIIRSKMDYACCTYGSARKSALRTLNTVHHTALRTASGAFRTSPIDSLYAICNEPSLEITRQRFSLNYYFRVLSYHNHPLHKFIKDNHTQFYYNRPSHIPSFFIKMQQILNNTSLHDAHVLKAKIHFLPPWKTYKFFYLNPFAGYNKSDISAEALKQLFAHHRSVYNNYIDVYTDGSKSESHVGLAYVCRNSTHSFSLHPSCTVYTAELIAIQQALKFISRHSKKQFIIYTDALSALLALKSDNFSHPVLFDILNMYNQLLSNNFKILFCWVPSHVGIAGNERADVAAKTKSVLLNSSVPYTDIKLETKRLSLATWQENWQATVGNKLHNIKPHLDAIWPVLSNRREDVVLTRIRIGHTRLTHVHLLLSENAPSCTYCHTPITVSHLLTSCSCFYYLYRKFFNSSSPILLDLVGQFPHQNLFKFLRATGLYYEV